MRPSDPRIDEALRELEGTLRGAGLVVSYRQAQQWMVELETGIEGDTGVLQLNHGKAGVFTARNWKRPPSESVRSMIDAVLETLGRG